MIRTAASVAALSALLATGTAAAQSNDQVFEEGSMLLLCVAPDPDDEAGAEASAAVFEEAFPRLVENLQVRANEGKVIRAHFLTELGDGMFIVVGGEDAGEAANNAIELQRESIDIIEEAIETAGAGDVVPPPDFCRMIPIGPVAVLPMQ